MPGLGITTFWVITYIISIVFIVASIWKYSVEYKKPENNWDNPLIVTGALAIVGMLISFISNVFTTITYIVNESGWKNSLTTARTAALM